MKKILFMLFMLLFLPITIIAEECDNSKISIDSLELVNKSDNTVIVNEASIVDNKIKVDLKFSDVNDYAQYSFVIKNDSKEDYELSDKSINIDSDYIDYTLSTDDNLNIIKAGEEKKVLLNVKYNKEVDSDSFENGEYKENKVMNLNYSYDKKSNPVVDILENPKTGVFKYVLILVALFVFAFLIVNEKKKSKILILLFMLMIPLSINALCTCEFKIESNVVIEKTSSKSPTFKYIITNCDGNSINMDFEFEEGMTFGEWINGGNFENQINNLSDIDENNIEFYKNSLFIAVRSKMEYDSVEGNVDDYILKNNDVFDYYYCNIK